MVNLLAGAALGFLSGLGVGGGSLLLLWLTLVMEVPQPQARLINLMFFLPCALTATLLRRSAAPDKALTRRAMIAGLIGALLGSLLSGIISPELLKKALGVLFLLTGIRELRYRPKQ